MTASSEANVVATAWTTAPARWFHTAPLPAIISELGACHAVRLLDGETVDLTALPELPDTLRGAAPVRVRSFVAGRHCAMRALTALDGAPHTVPSIGPFGAPVWPAGVVGSITHSANLAMAVVARADELRGIGIDCERIMSAELAEEIAARVLPEADRVRRRGDPEVRLPWPAFMTAVFSAKESIYKCLNPSVGVFFEFDAVALDWIDVAGGNMGFEVLADLGPSAPAGTLLTARFCVDGEHVVTAVARSASVAASHPTDSTARPPA